MTDCYCGIDIGGTKIAGGLVDSQGRVSSRAEIPTPVKAIGIGAGGQIDADKGGQ